MKARAQRLVRPAHSAYLPDGFPGGAGATATTLTAADGFADPFVTAATAQRVGDRTTVAFTSTATLTAEALSRRYTGQEGG